MGTSGTRAWTQRLVDDFSYPPSPKYTQEFIYPAAGVAVALMAIWLGTHLFTNEKPKLRGVPVKVAGPGDARRNWRYLAPLETPWEGATTLALLFEQAVKKNGSKKCLGTRKVIKREMVPDKKSGREFEKLTLGDYEWITYNQAFERIKNVSSGLIATGHKRGDKLAIFAETRADWIVTLQACCRQSIPVVTIYATLGEEALVYALKEAEVSTVVTSSTLLKKLTAAADKIETLTRVIYMDDAGAPTPAKLPQQWTVSPLREIEALGAKKPVEAHLPKPDDLAVIMYTSGSTGTPKGVLMPHSALVASSAGIVASVSNADPSWIVYLAYLPLAHVLELAAEHAVLALGAPLGYGSPGTLVDTSPKLNKGTKGDAPILKPTVMGMVPAIMDKIREGVEGKINEAGAFVKVLYNFAYSRRKASLKSRTISLPFEKQVWDKVVFSRVRALVGGNLQLVISGGAPLSKDTQRFMNVAMGCPIGQGYGLTETCAIGTISEMDDLSVGRVGPPVPSCLVKLIDWDEGGYKTTDNPFPRGEVCIGGPIITEGYLNKPDKTKEDFHTDEEGIRWFHSGDVGQWHPDGSLEIIDRKKDLVKLQHGEYVSLGKVEAAIGSSEYVDQVMVHADPFHSYTVALVVPNHKKLQNWAASKSLNSEDLEKLCKEKDAEEEVKNSIAQAAKHARLEKFEIPSKVKLVAEHWTAERNLVTEAMKLKRDNIRKEFKKELEAMYPKKDSR